jgi:hypothetical protein
MYLGSSSLTTNASGSIVSQLRYLPFGGTRWESDTTPTDFQFTGQRKEAGIGLYNYGTQSPAIPQPKLQATNSARTDSTKRDPRLYNQLMPTICKFDGIKIQMYYRDHLPPHFHAERSDEAAEITIDPIMILEGQLARPTRAKVFEWAAIHQAELRANWELARAHRPLLPIAPLD